MARRTILSSSVFRQSYHIDTRRGMSANRLMGIILRRQEMRVSRYLIRVVGARSVNIEGQTDRHTPTEINRISERGTPLETGGELGKRQCQFQNPQAYRYKQSAVSFGRSIGTTRAWHLLRRRVAPSSIAGRSHSPSVLNSNTHGLNCCCCCCGNVASRSYDNNKITAHFRHAQQHPTAFHPRGQYTQQCL